LGFEQRARGLRGRPTYRLTFNSPPLTLYSPALEVSAGKSGVGGGEWEVRSTQNVVQYLCPRQDLRTKSSLCRSPTPEIHTSDCLFFSGTRSTRGNCAAKGSRECRFSLLRLRHYHRLPKSLIPLATTHDSYDCNAGIATVNPTIGKREPHNAASRSPGRLRQRPPSTMTHLGHQSIALPSGPGLSEIPLSSVPVQFPLRLPARRCPLFENHDLGPASGSADKAGMTKCGLRRKESTLLGDLRGVCAM
jgi:hypothetical protein